MKLNDILCADATSLTNEVTARLSEATFVGIDFGTSTTTVTRLVYDSEEQQLFSDPLKIPQEDEDGVMTDDHLVPTVIARKRDGHLLFGQGAKACLLNREDYVEGCTAWTCFKMRLGENVCYPQTLMSRENPTEEGVYLETPKDAAELFFRYLKGAIESAVKRDGLPTNIKYAITVPASFAPNQREELCSAVRAAGIELSPAALLDEPNSAFMGASAYYAEAGDRAAFFRDDRDVNVLVFDFGAGTCDISLLKVSNDGQLQNLAISQFTALGGRDIDEKIATDILYPKVLSSLEWDEPPVMDVKKNLINKLRPVAEELKIAMCDAHESNYGESAFAIAKENPGKTVAAHFSYSSPFRPGKFDGEIEMSAAEFVGIMKQFTEPSMDAFEKGHKSIFDPIDDALRKAELTGEDIDFVLPVGGSSKSPFIREILRDGFSQSTQIMEAGDVQTLVARGAAIHSFTVNGFGQSFVTPITSEDIFIKTARGRMKIFAVGTKVPTPQKKIEGLYIEASEEEVEFGVPFYATVDERELGVARFRVPPFAERRPVYLTCFLEADKTLHYEIDVAGQTYHGAFMMPLSSEYVTPEETELVRARNNLDFVALRNGGVPTIEQYERVAKACEKLEKYQEAADYYRNLMYTHRGAHYEADAARCFREAGEKERALAWIRRACDYRKNYINVWYLIWDLQHARGWGDHELSRWLEYAFAHWPDDLDFRYIEVKQLEGLGDISQAKECAAKLCEAWEEEGVSTLDKFSLVRFETIARMCDKGHLVQEIRAQKKMIEDVGSSAGSKDSGYMLVDSKVCEENEEGGK